MSAAAPGWAPSRQTPSFSGGVVAMSFREAVGRQQGKEEEKNSTGHMSRSDHCGQRGCSHWETASALGGGARKPGVLSPCSHQLLMEGGSGDINFLALPTYPE